MTAYEATCRANYTKFKRAQLLSRTSVPRKCRKRIRQAIATNSLKTLPTTLKAKYPTLYSRLLKIFGPSVSQGCYPVFVGLAYPRLEVKCIWCGIEVLRLGRLGNIVLCSRECRKQHFSSIMSPKMKGIRAKETDKVKAQRLAASRKTSVRRYGVVSPMQHDVIKRKVQVTRSYRTDLDKRRTKIKLHKTLKTKYGVSVTNAMQVPEVRRRQERNVRLAYKRNNKEIQEYRTAKMLATHGVSHQIHREEVRNKIFKRSSITLADKTYLYQGYEHHVLKFLIHRGFRVTTKVAGIRYYKPVSSKPALYYPDIKAIKGNHKYIIEVKGLYTFNWTKTNCPEKFFVGTQWAKDQGGDYLVLIVNDKTLKAVLLKNPERLKDLRLKAGKLVDLST